MTFDDGAPPPDDNDAPFDGTNVRPLRRVEQQRIRVPPHDLAAEASLIGACLLSATRTLAGDSVVSKAISAAVDEGITSSDFYKPAHGHIWDALLELHHAGEAIDPVTVADVLHRDGMLEAIGGPPTLITLQSGTPAISNASRYARIVAEMARLRRIIHNAGTMADLAYSLPDDIDQVEATIAQLVTPTTRVNVGSRVVNGAAFLLDEPDEITSVWGAGGTCLWAEGEATMIVGPSGIGKTTLCQQVVLGRIGVRKEVLGQPVTEGNGRVLYLACDRPRQAARSMRRMVEEHDRELLEDLLVFWKGPLPFDVVSDVYALARFAKDQGADTVIIDSLKDICHKLNDDEHASKTNAAIQETIACGIEVGVLHHQRKPTAGTKKADVPKTLGDVYGNTWLTAGMGSVILVWGEAGDPIIELSHLKPPSEQVGPWTLRMDFDLGYTTIDEEVSPLKIVLTSPRGATAALVARLIFKTDTPTQNQIEKARYKLKKLVAQELIVEREHPSETGGKPTAMYFPAELRRAE